MRGNRFSTERQTRWERPRARMCNSAISVRACTRCELRSGRGDMWRGWCDDVAFCLGASKAAAGGGLLLMHTHTLAQCTEQSTSKWGFIVLLQSEREREIQKDCPYWHSKYLCKNREDITPTLLTVDRSCDKDAGPRQLFGE